MSDRAVRKERGPALPRGVRIVYEDDDLIVLDKPTGLVTADPRPQPGIRVPGRALSLFDALKNYVKGKGPRRDRASKHSAGPRRSAPVVWVLHRLDKEASGLVVFAKSERAFAWLKDDFKAKRVRRRYLLVVEGELGEPGLEATHQSFIREDRGPKRGRGQDRNGDDAGQLAVTHYKVLAGGHGRTLVEARLETGRKNQIRIHMNELGHPLIGDRRFGAKTDPIGRLALHAAVLGFSHPADGRAMDFESPAPDSFYKTVGADRRAAFGSDATSKPTPAGQSKGSKTERETSWQAVAGWYDDLMADKGNDHYEQVIIPGTLRLLEPTPGMNVLDIACGQGILARRLASGGCQVTGIDSAPSLIQAAQQRASGEASQSFAVGDARAIWEVLQPAQKGQFDAAMCIMALSNIDSLEPVMRGVTQALKPGGSFVFVITHPAFRPIDQSSWGWDDAAGRQFRRIDAYLTPSSKDVQMQPGKAARGKKGTQTVTFHRPLQAYVAALSKAGLLVDRLEEWPSLRASTSGPRAPEENRIRREIPLFLGVRATKR